MIGCERIGIINDMLGQYESALNWYQKSLALARTLAYRKQELTVLINMGESYRLQGKYLLAEQNYRQALALAQEFDHQDVQSTAIQNLGLVALARGDFHEAVVQLGQALVMHRAQGRQNPEAEVLCDLGRARAGLGDFQVAMELYRASLQLCHKLPYPDYTWRTCFAMARCQQAMGETAAARASIQSAITIIEQLRAQLPANTNLALFMQDKAAVYQLMEELVGT